MMPSWAYYLARGIRRASMKAYNLGMERTGNWLMMRSNDLARHWMED